MVLSPFVKTSLLKSFMESAACQEELWVVMAARNSPARLSSWQTPLGEFPRLTPAAWISSEGTARDVCPGGKAALAPHCHP